MTMVLLLIVIMTANSLILYRSINRYHRNEIRLENALLASSISDLLTSEPSLMTVRFIKNIFEINGIQGVVNTNDKGVLYSNLNGLKPREVLLRQDLVSARSEIVAPSGEVVGQVIIVERDTSATRIQTIFLITLVITGFFGLLMVLVLSFLLYKMVSKPLDHIMSDIANDRYIELNDPTWQVLVNTHNQAKDSRGRFFGEASHAMKTPLMNIQGSLEAFEDDIFSQEEMSEKITGEVSKLKETVDQMVRASKAETFTSDPNAWTPIDVEGFLNETLPLIPKGIHLEIKADPKPFTYDSKTLQIICDNLVQNALRYAKTKITITYTNDQHKVVLKVCDDGDGVEPALLDKVFEPFSKGRWGKTGLGLSIVKSYVTLTGGHIQCTNEKGACFTLTWPK